MLNTGNQNLLSFPGSLRQLARAVLYPLLRIRKPYIIRDHASIELIGYDEDHTIEGVFFENIVLDGKQVVAEQVSINEYVKGIQFE